MVYFKYLFQHTGDLSPVEGLVYSELVLHSLMTNPDYRSGTLYCKVAAELDLQQSFSWKPTIKYYPMETRKLMKNTELTFPTVKKTVKSLIDKGYILEEGIRCPLEMLNGGYIKIPYGTKAKGHQLIFYAYLLDRSYRHNGTVDTWAYRFKDLCGVNQDNVYFIIKQLKAKGLVEREGSILRILKPAKTKKKGRH